VKEAVVTVLSSASGRRLAAYVVLDKATAADSSSSSVLLDASVREQFKHQGLHLRSHEAASFTVSLSPELEAVEAFRERRSHRAFRQEPLPFKNFSRFLGQLRQLRTNGEAKYQYASAGGVYPVQVYLCIKPERIEGLGGGIYYYHPVHHELQMLSSVELTESVHWPANREAFRHSAFSIFLVAEKAAIEPLYGSKARDFCLIEAGILMQLLEAAAPACGLGNCQIGSVDLERVRELLDLTPSQEIVHSSVAGYALPAATQPLISAPLADAQTTQARHSVDALRRFVEGQLPAYMVPSVLVIMDKLPLGANGKVDRKGLPAIEEPRATPALATTKAIDDVLANKIAAAIAQELDQDEVPHNQNFFDLGATSLTLVRFANRLLKEHQIDAPLIDIFRYPTVTTLAQRLASAAPEAPTLEAERARAAKGHHARSRLARGADAGKSAK
jgi:SagB-type dehydrogenase family enzyme